MSILLKELTPLEWNGMAENAHLVGFKEIRPASMNRIDFALLAVTRDDVITGWVTGRELDAESVYYCWGAAMPDAQGTDKSIESFKLMVEWGLQKYKRISILVENTNVRCLKFVMNFGFRINGVRMFEGQVFAEMINTHETCAK